MYQLSWDKLLTTKRLGLETYHSAHRDYRGEFDRDFDRLIFSSPFRRLQNKTQVFPLPGSIFVHNRLTHSLEVSSVGRSIGNIVARRLLAEKHENSPLLPEIGAIVAAACLAHDLGNPPFGHSGERAIGAYFSEGEGGRLREQLVGRQWTDLTFFEGNANAFRLLTHQFCGRRKGGFAQTYSMLASIVKYPYDSTHASREKQKFGFFDADADTYNTIANALGIAQAAQANGHPVRHPLVYLVEAADDICYQIMDIEDAYKLRLLTREQTIELLLQFHAAEKREHALDIMNMVSDDNEQIAYLRSVAIGRLVEAAADAFIEHYQAIMNAETVPALIKIVDPEISAAYKQCSHVAVNHIYRSPAVLDVELSGYRIISTLMDVLVGAVMAPQKTYSVQILARVPEQYDVHATDIYSRLMAVVDYVSGMTDVYALDIYRKIMGINVANS